MQQTTSLVLLTYTRFRVKLIIRRNSDARFIFGFQSSPESRYKRSFRYFTIFNGQPREKVNQAKAVVVPAGKATATVYWDFDWLFGTE